MIRTVFDHGTLVWSGDDIAALVAAQPAAFKFDSRINGFRSRACDYAVILQKLRSMKLELQDDACAFNALNDLSLQETLVPRPHQQTAFDAWRKSSYRAVAALPTGSGKTILAVMAIARLKRSALVLVPTIDLMVQWANVLKRFFNVPVGMWGGGSSETCDITVSTYNSAVLKMEFSGNRFAFLIADECHHLPGPANQLAAQWAIAPYRLGLSATPESDPARDELLKDLMGDICCRIQIDELSQGILSDYTVETIPLELSASERAEYLQNRKIYIDFLHQHHLVMNSVRSWRNFIMEVARSGQAGRKAFEAYLKQKNIARSGEEKFRMVWELIRRHGGERIIIFTADNAAAYELGRRYLLPVLTHHTKSAERKNMLENFRTGECPVLVSSKVLNEGVDVPEANIGIIVSGGASVREHVQRLGRILRARPGKKAILYELVNASTSELSVSNRRREHRAYSSKVNGGSLC
ncbi:MAG: DEAD/DEAH box helicase family protein [Lentisphaeria bacterium]|nr:DEAD/DEAH box helicase family protein [Lentisphaeria bacterium]